MKRYIALIALIACLGCAYHILPYRRQVNARLTTLELRDARILKRLDTLEAAVEALQKYPDKTVEIEGSVGIIEGVVAFTINGEKVYEKRNVTTDTLKDEMITLLSVGGQSFDKVQMIGIEHRYNSGTGWDSNRTWHNVVYKSGAYDTCDNVVWTYTWTCPLNWIGDTLTCFYLSHDAYVLGDEVVGEKVYCIQDTTFYLDGGAQIRIDWKLQWEVGA